VTDAVGDTPSPHETPAEPNPDEPAGVLARVTGMLWSAALSAAVVTALAAITLAVYSLTAASRTSYASVRYLYAIFSGEWDAQSPTRIAAAAIFVGVAIAVVGVAGWWRGASEVWFVLILTSIAALFYVTLWSFGLVAFAKVALGNFLRSAQLPTALAAWLLAAGAALAVMAAAVLRGRRRPPQRSGLAAGAVLGVVSALVVGAAARTIGDDNRFVDSATAAPAPMAPIPDTLGRQRFHVKVSEETHRDRDGNDPVRVVAGGAGFIVLEDGLLTAYGSNGQPRWRYRRTGPRSMSVDWFDVYGATVIAKIGTPRWGPVAHQVLIAFDAVTGHQIWMSEDPDIADAVRPAYGLPKTYWHLVTKNSDSTAFAVIDPTSGHRTQTVRLAEHCSGSATDTRTRLVIVEQCGATASTDVRLLTVDPHTGKTTADQNVVTAGSEHPSFTVAATPAGADGVQVLVEGVEEAARAPLYLNAVTNRVVPGVPGISLDPLPSRDPAGNYLADFSGVAGRPPSEAWLMGNDGARRCVLGGGTTVDDRARHGAFQAWLGREILIVSLPDRDRRSDQLRLINRADCSVAADLPNPNDRKVFDTVVAPGVAVIAYMDATGTYLDGYN
jgi:hypothetical protein